MDEEVQFWAKTGPWPEDVGDLDLMTGIKPSIYMGHMLEND